MQSTAFSFKHPTLFVAGANRDPRLVPGIYRTALEFGNGIEADILDLQRTSEECHVETFSGAGAVPSNCRH